MPSPQQEDRAKKVLGGSEETEWKQGVPEREMEVRRDGRRLSPEGGCEMDTLRKSPEIKGPKRQQRHKVRSP